ADADAAIVTSYCPDAAPATELVLDAPAPRRIFYDLDTPVTLERLERGDPVEYLPADGLGGFDLVLSFTGGRALAALREQLGARRVAPLYGSVDAAVHSAAPAIDRYRADLSYLGTWSADRQPALEEFLLAPARLRPRSRFLVAGALYPRELRWPPNVVRYEHLPPGEHAACYSSARLSLNLTRAPMARLGWCPSGRLFEAAACGAPIVSDRWLGLEAFFTPGEEILVARTAFDVMAAIDLPRSVLHRVGRAARERALAEHTAEHRARELLALLGGRSGGAHDGNHSGGGDRQPDPA